MACSIAFFSFLLFHLETSRHSAEKWNSNSSLIRGRTICKWAMPVDLGSLKGKHQRKRWNQIPAILSNNTTPTWHRDSILTIPIWGSDTLAQHSGYPLTAAHKHSAVNCKPQTNTSTLTHIAQYLHYTGWLLLVRSYYVRKFSQILNALKLPPHHPLCGIVALGPQWLCWVEKTSIFDIALDGNKSPDKGPSIAAVAIERVCIN